MKSRLAVAAIVSAATFLPALAIADEAGASSDVVSITVAGKTRAQVRAELARAESAGLVPGYNYPTILYPRGAVGVSRGNLPGAGGKQ
jgi:hypothetical protein